MSWWTINSLEILVFFFRPMIWCKLLFKILIFKQSSRNYTLMLMHPIDFQMQDPWAVVEWTGFLKIHFDGTDYANDSQVDSGYILKKEINDQSSICFPVVRTSTWSSWYPPPNIRSLQTLGYIIQYSNPNYFFFCIFFSSDGNNPWRI